MTTSLDEIIEFIEDLQITNEKLRVIASAAQAYFDIGGEKEWQALGEALKEEIVR